MALLTGVMLGEKILQRGRRLVPIVGLSLFPRGELVLVRSWLGVS